MQYTELSLPTLAPYREEPVFADVEVIERTAQEVSVIVPNELRINGLPVHSPAGSPITVEVRPGESLVEVTVTLIAKRVVFDQERL